MIFSLQEGSASKTQLDCRRRQDTTDCSASQGHDSPIDIKGFGDGTLQSASYAKVSQAL